ncbi:carbon-nitrogen hydrolase family protein [Paremcibacter congregatus]|nr:carbon-nitrogen hydrolase family protein [Paremcibacter congregatus]
MDQTTFKIGLVQMSSGNQRADNMVVADNLIREAVARGADLVMTPEMTTLIGLDRTALMEQIFTEASDPSLKQFQRLARDLGIWLMIGSMAVRVGDKIANRCYMIDPTGLIVNRYDKIHMFDVDLPNGESYRESRSYEAGAWAVISETPWGKLGHSICYDVRFPGLYRTLAQAGAQMLTVPAAFTRVTGEAHWHILLRARAIENGVFVFAPAQTGTHENAKGVRRETYGHSLIVDPWGNILDDGGTDVGVTVAEIDLALCDQARERIPSLAHDREFKVRL